MAKNRAGYLAYLLRLWQVNNANKPTDRRPQESTWRASLEEPITRKRIGFSSLDALFEYLIAQADQALQRDVIQIGDEQKEQQQ